MRKLFSKILFLSLLLSGNVYADDRCSEERKQWVEFYKQDFASNFSKIEYSDDPCVVSAISFEIKESGSNSLLNLGKEDGSSHFEKLSAKIDINWVPEYFEINASHDYLYGAYYHHNENYADAILFLGDFLKTNVQDRLTAKAQFLYGESFRLIEDYIEAAQQYVDVYEKFNKSEFRPISLLRLGEMMIKIDYKDKGCEVINHFQYEFNYAEDAIYRESEALLEKYDCPKVVLTDSKILLVEILQETKILLE
jgi:TolA-binding protein